MWSSKRSNRERERERETGAGRERVAAAATFTTPQLVDKPGARRAMFNYFGFKTMSTLKPLTPKHHCANGVTKHVWPTWQNT